MEKIFEWLKSHPLVIGGIIAVFVALYFLFRANSASASANAASAQSAADQAAYNAQSSGGNPLYGGSGFGASVPVTSTPTTTASAQPATDSGVTSNSPVNAVPSIASPSTGGGAPDLSNIPVSAQPFVSNLVSSGQLPAMALTGFTTNYAGVQTPIPVGMNNNSDFTPHVVVPTTQAAPSALDNGATPVKPLYQTPLTVGGSKTLL